MGNASGTVYGGALGKIVDIDLYRAMGKGNYDTDFSFTKTQAQFPSAEVVGRNAVYRYLHRLYSGEYGRNKKLVAMIDNVEKPLPYYTLQTNFFKLIVNKLDSLIFSNDIIVNSGDIERDAVIAKLIERTSWADSIRRAVKKVEIFGDCPIKTYSSGVSAFDPMHAFKVVDKDNKQSVKAYVLVRYINTKVGNTNDIKHVKLEVHTKGYIFEKVYMYSGSGVIGNIGPAVEYNYDGRVIPVEGTAYSTGVVDCELVQWMSINREADGVYGESSLHDIKDIVFTLEQRLSSEIWILDNHEKPYLILGMDMVQPDEQTGGYKLRAIDGKYMIGKNTDKGTDPHYLTWDGKNDISRNTRIDLMSYFYELSELGKTYLSGEYTGNISEETLNNTIKSAIDRGNRDCNDIWYEVRKSLYVLCRLNDIEVNIEDLNVNFNIGRTDDDKQVAEIIDLLNKAGVFSKSTLLQKYYGYNDEQATEELNKITIEKGGDNNDVNGSAQEDIRGQTGQ